MMHMTPLAPIWIFAAEKDRISAWIGNATPFQLSARFFFSIAQVWRRNVRPERLRMQIKTYVHSQAEFRVNGPLPNLQAFYDAFGCDRDGRMYLTPDKRSMIWKFQ